MSKPRREPQLAYSELQHKTRDEQKRRRKAAKIVSVLEHFLGRADLSGLTALDIGCSTGYAVDTLRAGGATALGIDIDVYGLAHAQMRFGDAAGFICGDGAGLPFAAKSIDIVVFNHIYEHVVDADAVMGEIRRVLTDDGVAYLGLGNKMQVIEPHYQLPFLSWLPRRAADRYVTALKRGDSYYERFRRRSALLEMCRGLRLWDYTYTVLSDSQDFQATDMVPDRLAQAPPAVWRGLLAPIMPTFIWVATPRERWPLGRPVRQSPIPLRPPATP